jgi:hypothetical protein
MKHFILFLFGITLLTSVTFGQTQVCPDAVCVNTANQDYFVTNTIGSTYQWTLTGGGVIASGQGTSLIFINWGNVAGSYQLQVIETNASGCVGTPVFCQIDVYPFTPVSIQPLGPFCAGDPLVNLVGNPAGGTWSGNGVTGSQFNPAAGNSTITYTFTNANGCTSTATYNVVVNPLPNTSPIYKQ